MVWSTRPSPHPVSPFPSSSSLAEFPRGFRCTACVCANGMIWNDRFCSEEQPLQRRFAAVLTKLRDGPPTAMLAWCRYVLCAGGRNWWLSTELMRERLVVPGVPHFDDLALRKAKENELLDVEGVSGRRPRSPPT